MRTGSTEISRAVCAHGTFVAQVSSVSFRLHNFNCLQVRVLSHQDRTGGQEGSVEFRQVRSSSHLPGCASRLGPA